MSFPIIVDSTNYINNNTFKIDLSSTTDLSDYGVSVADCYVYYSWYNINSNLGNNQFTLTIPTSGASTNLNVVIPDGAYNITDLNNFLQFTLIAGGYYIYDTTTLENTYYIAFALSPTSYSVQLTTTSLPTSLPAGYTSGGMTFPGSSNQHYQLTISSANTFKDIIGYDAGTYPSSATYSGEYTKDSDYTPNVSPISAIQIRLSCLYNPFSSNSQLLHVFTNAGSRVGEIIDGSANYESFVPCIGMHKELTLTFYDQLGRVLNLLDSNITIKLNFKKIKNLDK